MSDSWLTEPITEILWIYKLTRRKVLKVAKIKDASHGCKDEGNSVSQICIKSEFQNEPPSKLFSIGPLWSVYKAFFENPMFSPSSGFLIVLHPPSRDDFFFVNYPPLSYIKSCVLACRLRIWTSYLVLPRQNIKLKPQNWQNLTILHKWRHFACFSAIIQYFA